MLCLSDLLYSSKCRAVLIIFLIFIIYFSYIFNLKLEPDRKLIKNDEKYNDEVVDAVKIVFKVEESLLVT